jgi:opacity protein-like surface antigen
MPGKRAVTSLLVLIGLLTGAAPALAQGWGSVPFAASRGPYLSAGGGLSLLQSIDFDIEGISFSKATFDAGWLASLSGGYAFENGLRAELEAAYRRNNIEKFGRLDGSGNLSAATLMANAYYDFDIGNWPVTPYLGAGIGVARIRASNIQRNLVACCPQVDGSDTVFAFQFIAGAQWRITPNFSASLDYRFLGTTRFALDSRQADISNKARGHYYDHGIMLSLRWTFPTK